jgi:hypothetical protein
VYFASKPTLEELVDLRADLTEALHFEEVDLVPLNDAHPLLRFEAVSGRRLFVRDLETVAAFVSLTAREAEDANALVQRGIAYLKKSRTLLKVEACAQRGKRAILEVHPALFRNFTTEYTESTERIFLRELCGENSKSTC